MFPNLNAEQARYDESNALVAEFLGISRASYESKKKNGSFSISDANKLCERYNCEYAYLFSEDPISPSAD